MPDKDGPTAAGSDDAARATPQDTDPEASTVDEGGRASDPGEALIKRGASVGPFLVVDYLGAGGMGVVVSAYDASLDRKVALKLLRPVPGAPLAEARRTRLQREAQAMARLTHPNVAAVHQVGVVGEQVFIAMEYVDGDTLRAWLRKPRPWREIVTMLVAAGRGLGAAHRAGLVHRDFKPDNVLVGRDGRPRVTDFGLAAPDATGSSSQDMQAPSPGTALSESLTRTGARIGTPYYMAPEQHDGRPVDGRADQFAFCVVLYEALYKQRPFAGDGLADLAENVRRGAVRPFPRDADAPAWIRPILLRGLLPDPAPRFPTIDLLLDALERGPPRTGRRVAFFAAGAAVVAATALAVVRVSRPTPPCRGAEARLAGVWDGAVKDQVQKLFLASGRPYAAAVYTRVAHALDGYTAEWTAMRTEACEATRVRHEQSDALLDARMRCLDRRLDALAALTQRLAHDADPAVVDRAIQAASALEQVSPCGDPAVVMATIPPPTDVALRRRVDAVRKAVDDARALTNLGKKREALPGAKQAAGDAHAIGYRPLEAEALLTLGSVQIDTDDAATCELTLRQALAAASDAHDDARAATALTYLMWVVGVKGARRGDGLALEPAADAAVRRAGDDDLQRALFLNTLGMVLEVDGRSAAARDAHERALALREKRLGPDSLEVAKILTSIAVTLNDEGRYVEARARLERALAITTRVLGDDHTEVGLVLNTLGNIALHSDELAEAERDYRRALDIFTRAVGPESQRTAAAMNNLALALASEEKYDEGLELYARVLALRQKLLGPDHPEVAQTLDNMGIAYISMKKVELARAAFARALAIYEKALGPDSANVATAAFNLGSLEDEAQRHDVALPLLRRAVAIRDKVLGKEHVFTGTALLELGRCLVDLGRPAEAQPLLERALAIADRRDSASSRAAARFALARALVTEDRRRAGSLAREAASLYKEKPAGAAQGREIDGWRAQHGL